MQENDYMIFFAGLGAALLLLFIWFVASYNRFIKLQAHLRESWSDIDVELKRRYDLIPNLVEVVKSYAKHEKSTLESLVKLRADAVAEQGSPDQQGAAESKLQMGIGKIFALAESYPELKANKNFLELQKELAITEDRIAATRRFFNGNVRDFNSLCESFPTNILAGIFGFKKGSYFELTNEAERVVPRVDSSVSV